MLSSFNSHSDSQHNS